MIRESEAEKEFREKLKNPLKPINSTETGPEMADYLKKLNSGELIAEEKRKKEEELKKRNGENIKHCKKCNRPYQFKRTPSGAYCCGYCGLISNTP
jgi:hypothetical protein